MSKVIFTRGIQGSGKSTWAKQWAMEDPDHRIRISWDDLRNMYGQYWVPNREPLVTNASVSILKDAMNRGLDVVIDNMNLSESSKKSFLTTIEKHNNYVNDSNIVKPDQVMYTYEIEYKDFFIPVEECIRRDSMRPNPIGEAIIKQTWNRYRTMICTLENEKVASRINPYRDGFEKAIVFDLDATLSFNLTGRPYWGEGCAEGIKNDAENTPLVNLFKTLQQNGSYKMIVLTGREGTEDIINASEQWLTDHGIDTKEILFVFRPKGSKVKGTEYKLNTLKDLRNTYDIEFVVDDSQKIVDVLRENGYTVLQPNEGKF